MPNFVIQDIRVRLRDEQTGQTEEHSLHPGERWRVGLETSNPPSGERKALAWTVLQDKRYEGVEAPAPSGRYLVLRTQGSEWGLFHQPHGSAPHRIECFRAEPKAKKRAEELHLLGWPESESGPITPSSVLSACPSPPGRKTPAASPAEPAKPRGDAAASPADSDARGDAAGAPAEPARSDARDDAAASAEPAKPRGAAKTSKARAEAKPASEPSAPKYPAKGEVSMYLKSVGDQANLLAKGATAAWIGDWISIQGQKWESVTDGMSATFVDRPDLLRDLDQAVAEYVPLDVAGYTNRHITLKVEKINKDRTLISVLGASNTAWAKYHPYVIGEVKWGTKEPTRGKTRFVKSPEGVPFAVVGDYASLKDDLLRQFPDANLDFEHYEEPREKAAEAKTPAAQQAAPREKAADAKTPREKTTEAKAPATPRESGSKPEGRKRRAPGSKKGERKGPRQLTPGAGPGELNWDEVVEEGLKGLAATRPGGRLMILRAAPGAYALFFQYAKGGFEQIACGAKVDDLKHQAAGYVERKTTMTVAEHLAQVPCAAAGPESAANVPAPKEPKEPKEPKVAKEPKEPTSEPETKKEKAMQEPEKKDEDESEKELLASLRAEIKDTLAEEEDD